MGREKSCKEAVSRNVVGVHGNIEKPRFRYPKTMEEYLKSNKREYELSLNKFTTVLLLEGYYDDLKLA